MKKRIDCRVVDGMFVEPCETLGKTIAANGLSKARGVGEWALFKDGKPSRRFYGVRSGEFAKDGILFNWCPFCGVQIDTPFADEEPTHDD